MQSQSFKVEGVLRDGHVVVRLHGKAVEGLQLKISTRHTGREAPIDYACALNWNVENTVASVEPVSLEDRQGNVLGVDFSVLLNGSTIPSEHIDRSGWQLQILRVLNREQFNKVMRYAYQRVRDPETLMEISWNTAITPGVDARIRMSSFVVFCYRAIELGRQDYLMKAVDRFSLFEDEYDSIRHFTEGSVRENGEQVILSMRSVQWHVLISLGLWQEAETTLDQILDHGRGHPVYSKLSFATNYANAAVLKSYLTFRRGRSNEGSATPAQDFYEQFRTVMKDLPEEIPPHDYLREFVPVVEKMAVASDLNVLQKPENRLALANNTASDHIRRRHDMAQKIYTPQRIYKMCARIVDCPQFEAAFTAFCAPSNSLR